MKERVGWSLIVAGAVAFFLGWYPVTMFLEFAGAAVFILAPTDEQVDAWRRNHED